MACNDRDQSPRKHVVQVLYNMLTTTIKLSDRESREAALGAYRNAAPKRQHLSLISLSESKTHKKSLKVDDLE